MHVITVYFALTELCLISSDKIPNHSYPCVLVKNILFSPVFQTKIVTSPKVLKKLCALVNWRH